MRVATAVLIFLFLFIMFITPAAAQGGDTITGVVLSSRSQSVPDATVTLYDMDGYLVDAPNNPQQSSGGVGTEAGIYTFYDVPPGLYNVTAEKNGIMYFAIADLSGGGTATANIVLPDYIETGPISGPSPGPIEGLYYYFFPVRMGKEQAEASVGEGLLFGMALLGGLGALTLFASRKWGG